MIIVFLQHENSQKAEDPSLCVSRVGALPASPPDPISSLTLSIRPHCTCCQLPNTQLWSHHRLREGTQITPVISLQGWSDPEGLSGLCTILTPTPRHLGISFEACLQRSLFLGTPQLPSPAAPLLYYVVPSLYFYHSVCHTLYSLNNYWMSAHGSPGIWGTVVNSGQRF